MNKSVFTLIALLVALAIFFSVNLASSALFRSARVDLTESRLYTLSEGTRNILGGMQEPVTLRLYYSKKLAGETPGLTHINDYANRVQETLQEYVSSAKGKLELFVVDPEPFSEDEDRAVGYGLQGAPANRSGDQLFFGLVGTNTTDQEETIPFFQLARQEFLEYDLTRLVYKLAYAKESVVGLLSWLPLEGGGFDPRTMRQGTPPWMIADQLRELAEVRTIAPSDTSIPAEVDVLVVVHPKEPSQELLYAIDQFVLRGGKLIAFMDPHCEEDPVPQDPNNPLAGVSANRSSTLGPLLTAWGVEMPREKIAADRRYALEVGYQGKGVAYVPFLALDAEAMAKEDPVTAQLRSVRVGAAGILRPLPGATTSFQPLLRTSEESMEIDRMSVALYPDPVRLLGEFVPNGQRLTVAARLGGRASTAFPGGDPKQPAPSNGGEEPAQGSPGETVREGDINVILVADADMLADKWWVRVMDFLGQRIASPTANNSDFLINAIDNMSGSADLIGLRSRPSFGRPFEKVAEIRRAADERFQDEQRQLEQRLRDIEQRINELQNQKGDGVSSLILTPEQREQIEEARREQVNTRKRLRDVRHSQKKEIESLGRSLKAINVLAVPLGVAILALGLGTWRARRSRD